MTQQHSVFLLLIFKEEILVTSRDKGLAFGLPGGKVDPGETPEDALFRECHEEGVLLPPKAELVLHHTDVVEGNPVEWYTTSSQAYFPFSYKEKGRGIVPQWMSLEVFLKAQWDSGDLYRNAAAILK